MTSQRRAIYFSSSIFVDPEHPVQGAQPGWRQPSCKPRWLEPRAHVAAAVVSVPELTERLMSPGLQNDRNICSERQMARWPLP